jgi:predicted N-formylglutamate amidohydrolase
MIEIRNDEIRTEAGQSSWGNRLASIFDGIGGSAQHTDKEIANREGGTTRSDAGVRRQTVGR